MRSLTLEYQTLLPLPLGGYPVTVVLECYPEGMDHGGGPEELQVEVKEVRREGRQIKHQLTRQQWQWVKADAFELAEHRLMMRREDP